MSTPKLLAGTEAFSGMPDSTVRDFWSWAYSDLMGNTTRGVLAEFLVARALGVADQPRVEWNHVDLQYGDWKIEVKTSAYVQTWSSARPSKIQFDVARKRGWSSTTNTTLSEPRRDAHVYVFCVCGARDAEPISALDVAAWRFYPVATPTLERELGGQKTAALSTVERLARAVGFAGVRAAVDGLIARKLA